MTDEKDLTKEKPKSLWSTALKVVRGEDTSQLIEQFTGEMTLVAEGLYEDQQKIRKELETLRSHLDLVEHRLKNDVEVLETTQKEQHRDVMAFLDDLKHRLDNLEGKMKSSAKTKSRFASRGWLGGLILLASIICGSWVLVTVLQLFK